MRVLSIVPVSSVTTLPSWSTILMVNGPFQLTRSGLAPHAFAAAWDEGQALPLEQAVAEGLGEGLLVG
jgi:hypothetical protein